MSLVTRNYGWKWIDQSHFLFDICIRYSNYRCNNSRPIWLVCRIHILVWWHLNPRRRWFILFHLSDRMFYPLLKHLLWWMHVMWRTASRLLYSLRTQSYRNRRNRTPYLDLYVLTWSLSGSMKNCSGSQEQFCALNGYLLSRVKNI